MCCTDCSQPIESCICGSFGRYRNCPEDRLLREFFTCSGMPETGDQGQRYEVRYADGDGKERVMGWTEAADGGSLVRSINKHPVWHSPRIIDRRPS